MLDATAAQLDEYFAGTRTAFDLPLDLHGTPFQLAAWQALAEIPYGETRTYGEQADRIGRPSAVRAIGAANGRNPVSIVLPCHRVIGSNGSLVGFGGGLEVKAALLELGAGASDWRTLRAAEAGTPPGGSAATLLAPGRARWGDSGSLNPKSAPAGPNAVRGTVSSGLGLRTRC